VELNNVDVSFMKEDLRPAFVLDQVKDADFEHVKAQKAAGVPTFVLQNVEGFSVNRSTPVPDAKIPKADHKEF
jgi:hypothetical protein